MAEYYIYLISSLPVLQFGAKPPFSMDKFFSICSELIPEKDMEALRISMQNEGEDEYHHFEIALRNELVKIRAQRKHVDAAKFLRRDGYADQWVSHIASGAWRNPSIIERERMLDMDRWRFLDELSIGHYFDLEYLKAYARKLSILEKWEKIRISDPKKLLEEVFAI